MLLHFAKYTGTGNDFILIDNRDGTITLSKEVVASLCSRHHGIGADGIIFLEKSPTADFKMRIFNADGSEAEMCGNGIRCLAHHVRRLGFDKSSCVIETMKRLHEVTWEGERISIEMGDPTDIDWHINLSLPSQLISLSYLDTGVPHAVIFCEEIGTANLPELAPAIRHHPQFSPKGANVNFAQMKNNEVLIRTYERGVEAETEACGTGATAVAIAAAKKYGLSPPIDIRFRSGELLSINFCQDNKSFSQVYMTGSAKHIFDGTVELQLSQ